MCFLKTIVLDNLSSQEECVAEVRQSQDSNATLTDDSQRMLNAIGP